MRKPRIKITDGAAVYHCIARVVGGQFLLEERDREMLQRMAWQQADFCGVQLITHSILSSHAHFEVRVPEPGPISDETLLGRAERFYDSKSPLLRVLRQAMTERGALPEDLREKLRKRMGDVSVFMKELKQRFSRWYNADRARFGTLWAERFRSVLIEDRTEVVGVVAAYIDLNAVRAWIAPDPKDYPFCGYGEAVRGNRLAQSGLLSFLGTEDWEKGGAEYRMRLYVEGGTAGESGKAMLDRDAIREVLKAGGKIDCGQALRLRIRYFQDGLVLGSEGWVNEVFMKFRDRFGPRRKTGARKLRGLPFEGLRTARDLRKNVLS